MQEWQKEEKVVVVMVVVMQSSSMSLSSPLEACVVATAKADFKRRLIAWET